MFSDFDPIGVDATPEQRKALDELFIATYEELRKLASLIRSRDEGATLNATALVNEAWMRMANSPQVGAASRLHFKRIAARAMRQILIEAARRRHAKKRGGGEAVPLFVTLGDTPEPVASTDRELLALNAALDELERMNPRQAVMVESRFFGGLDIPETAALLDVSEATVIRDWRAARAWLAREVERIL